MKKIYAQLLVLAVLVTIALALIYIQQRSPAKNTIPASPAETQAPYRTLDLASIAKATFTNTNDPAYDIHGEYPVQTPGEDHIRKIIDAELAQFKSDANASVAELTQDQMNEFGPTKDHQYAFITVYKAYKDPYYLTHRIDVYEFTGGAHGSTTATTFTYDGSGKQVTLGDILIDGTRSLQALSDKVIAILKTPAYADRISTDWFEDGAAPTPDNYGAFAFDGGNLVIIFQQYQIGPYSSGIIEVPVPLAELSGVLKQEYLRQ